MEKNTVFFQPLLKGLSAVKLYADVCMSPQSHPPADPAPVGQSLQVSSVGAKYLHSSLPGLQKLLFHLAQLPGKAMKHPCV